MGCPFKLAIITNNIVFKSVRRFSSGQYFDVNRFFFCLVLGVQVFRTYSQSFIQRTDEESIFPSNSSTSKSVVLLNVVFFSSPFMVVVNENLPVLKSLQLRCGGCPQAKNNSIIDPERRCFVIPAK